MYSLKRTALSLEYSATIIAGLPQAATTTCMVCMSYPDEHHPHTLYKFISNNNPIIILWEVHVPSAIALLGDV